MIPLFWINDNIHAPYKLPAKCPCTLQTSRLCSIALTETRQTICFHYSVTGSHRYAPSLADDVAAPCWTCCLC